MTGRFRVVSEGDGWWFVQKLGVTGWKTVHTDMNAKADAFTRFDALDKAKDWVSGQCDQPADRAASHAAERETK